MAENVIGVMFEVAADPSQAVGALGSFRSEFNSSIAAIQSRFSSFVNENLGLFSQFAANLGITAGVLAGVGAGLFELASKAAEAGGAIHDANIKTGISVENLSALRSLATATGASFDGLSNVIARMEKNLSAGISDPSSKAGKSLADLMGSSEQLTKLGLMPMEQQLITVLQRIFALGNEGQINAELFRLFGRGAIQYKEALQELFEQG